MLGGRNQHPFFDQAGGVAHARHILADSFDFKTVEVDAAKDDSRLDRSRQDLEMNLSSGMQANAVAADGCSECLFVDQEFSCSLE
jgi:hypothetical protein